MECRCGIHHDEPVRAVPKPFMDLWDRLIGGWGHEWTTSELASMTIALGLIAFAVMWLIQQWDPLRFALIPSPLKTSRAHDAAIKHFKVGAERRTHGRTGVLIYLSMQEHRAEIVATNPSRRKSGKSGAMRWRTCLSRSNVVVSPREWRRACAMSAWCRTFPAHEDDKNELPDRLIEV